MDPIACIVSMMEGPDTFEEHMELRNALKGWYAIGGFHPTVGDVLALYERRTGDSVPDPDRRMFLTGLIVHQYGCYP